MSHLVDISENTLVLKSDDKTKTYLLAKTQLDSSPEVLYFIKHKKGKSRDFNSYLKAFQYYKNLCKES